MSEPYYTLRPTDEFGNYSDNLRSDSAEELLDLAADTATYPNPYVRLQFAQNAYYRAAKTEDWNRASRAAEYAHGLHIRIWSPEETQAAWANLRREAFGHKLCDTLTMEMVLEPVFECTNLRDEDVPAA